MKKVLLASVLGLCTLLDAQVTGSKTIGTDYPTLAAAFAELNATGVGVGGATINIPAGYTETAPIGGFVLGNTMLNASLSATNPLVIKKNGNGVNPVFTGNVGTITISTLNNVGDCIFKFLGVDYLTIDGIDLMENPGNTTIDALNERGFAFLNLSATDGCQANTIQNSKITFPHAVNNRATGIYFAHYNTSGTTVTPTTADGLNSYNSIYSNTIEGGASQGIVFNGYLATSLSMYDMGNIVGAEGKGNTLSNFGGLIGNSAYVTNYAIYGLAQSEFNASYNNITFATGGYGAVGIYVGANNSAAATANNNTISVPDSKTYYASTSSRSAHSGISSSGTLTTTANNNIIDINVNGFYNELSGLNPQIVYGIDTNIAIPQGTIITNFTAIGNTITTKNSEGFSTAIYSTTNQSNTITDNKLSGIIGKTGASGIALNTVSSVIGSESNILRNKIYDITTIGDGTGTGIFAIARAIGISISASSQNSTVNIANNIIGDIKAPVVNSTNVLNTGAFGIGLFSTTGGDNVKYNVYYNSIYLNGTSSGANFNATGIYHKSGASNIGVLDLRNNIIVNLSTPKGTGRAAAIRRDAAALTNYTETSNNNDFAVGTAANSSVYYNGTTAYNFASFQTHVATRESASKNINPVFKSTNGSSVDFLNINASDSANQPLDNMGTPIAGYTTDYAGVIRNTATPDAGAYEFAYDLAVSAVSKANISVYPNPFTDVVRISDVKNVKSVFVSDMIGRQVKTLAPAEELNLSSLKTGVYVITLQMKDGSVATFKAVKK